MAGLNSKSATGWSRCPVSSSEYQDAIRFLAYPKTFEVASHEVTVFLRVLLRESYRLFGSSVPLRRCALPRRPWGFPSRTIPTIQGRWFILSQTSALLQRPVQAPPFRSP